MKQKESNSVINILLHTSLFSLSSTFFAPVISIYLAEELSVSPFLIGFYFFLSMISSTVISQYLAHRSDKNLSRKTIIQFSSLIASTGCILFAMSESYFSILLFGAIFVSVSSAAVPQLFAIMRELNQHESTAITLSLQRAVISISWVIGPAISFTLLNHLGYKWVFVISAILYFISFLLSFSIQKKESPCNTKTIKLKSLFITSRRVSSLAVAFILLYAAVNMYTITLPLYIVQTLSLDIAFVGLLMGFAALLEVPLIIFSGYAVKKFNGEILLIVGMILGLVFYIILPHLESKTSLIVFQFFNASLIGVTSSVGLIIFQNLLPQNVGTASALYNNAIRVGMGFGAILTGVVINFYGNTGVLYACGVLTVSAIFILLIPYKRKIYVQLRNYYGDL
ncbi:MULTISPECIES: sugar efflux transporter [Vibrio]|uniref:sugar efflux transporter n=1 Tax=Vibrio TaxID=662 RepID=UPI0012FFE175|nr:MULTISPECIES: sugar efflux transporter [Vibrio]